MRGTDTPRRHSGRFGSRPPRGMRGAVKGVIVSVLVEVLPAVCEKHNNCEAQCNEVCL